MIAEAELEMIDGITAGTAAASKALVLDANKDIGTIRNLTIDGTFSDGNYTFDTAGNVSGLGTVGCGAVTSTGVVTGTGFTIGNAVIAEAELEMLDGITAGTAAASKALVVDANKDIGTIRNLTIDGTFSDGNYTFDTAGNVSSLGTVGCGAVTSTGRVVTTDNTNATSTSDGSMQTAGGLSVTLDAVFGDDISLISDQGVINFGVHSDVSLIHSPDTGLSLQTVNAGNVNGAKLTMRLSSSTPADNDVISEIAFAGYTDTGVASSFAGIVGYVKDVTNDSKRGAIGFDLVVGNSMVPNVMDIGGTTLNTITVKDGAYDFDVASHDGTNGLKLAGTLVSSTAAELNKLDGADGDVTAAKLNSLCDLTTAEIGYMDGATAGTAVASKALVLDGNKDVGTIRNLTIDGTFSDGNYTFDTAGNVSGLGTVGCSTITSTGVITGTGFTIGSAVIAEAELEMIDGITAGSAAASKAMVLSAEGFIGGITQLTASNIKVTNLDVTNINSVTTTETILEVVDKLIIVGSGSASAAMDGGGYLFGGTGVSDAVAGLVWEDTGNKLEFRIGATAECTLDAANFIIAGVDLKLAAGKNFVAAGASCDIGTSGQAFDNIYGTTVHAGDLCMQNARGSWRVIEENDFLTLRNEKTGKRFKFNMTLLPEDEWDPDSNWEG